MKIFLTADAHVRALRRYEEFTAKGINCTLENVEREVIERDERDMNGQSHRLNRQRMRSEWIHHR